MKLIYIGLIILVLVLIGFTAHHVISSSESENQIISSQYENTLELVRGTSRVPRSKREDGTLRANGVYNWTSGFFAGNLWYLYELTNDEQWKNEAIKILTNVSNPPNVASEDEVNYFYLKNSVGSVSHGVEVSTSTSYADYYYFEALLRKREIDNK